jgi:hypothetical protein
MSDWPSKLSGTSAPTQPTSRSYAGKSPPKWPIKKTPVGTVATVRPIDLFRIDLLDLDNRALGVTTILALECSLFPTRLVGFNESERHHRSSAVGARQPDHRR